MAETTPTKRTRWSAAVEDQVRLRHAEGQTLYRIAKDLNLDQGTLSRKSATLGLSWDRAPMAAANEARRISNAERRADLVARLYGRADVVLGRLEKPTFRTLVKGSFGVEELKTLDVVPPQDEKALVQAIGSILTAAARLEAVDADGGTDAVRSVLGDLGRALGLQAPDTPDAATTPATVSAGLSDEGSSPGADTPGDDQPA